MSRLKGGDVEYSGYRPCHWFGCSRPPRAGTSFRVGQQLHGRNPVTGSPANDQDQACPMKFPGDHPNWNFRQDRSGGFHKWGYPQMDGHGWFISWKMPIYNECFGGTPILGDLHMALPMFRLTRAVTNPVQPPSMEMLHRFFSDLTD